MKQIEFYVRLEHLNNDLCHLKYYLLDNSKKDLNSKGFSSSNNDLESLYGNEDVYL